MARYVRTAQGKQTKISQNKKLNIGLINSLDRVFVQNSIKEKFLGLLVERTENIIVGDPMNENTCIGPMIMHPKNPTTHLEKVSNIISMARNDPRCDLIHGGKVEGNFVFPTIFWCNDNESEIVNTEIFGPVMTILGFEDEEEAVVKANKSDYGLAAGIITSNLRRAHNLAQQLNVGYVWINNYNLTPVEMPFGGRKMSGFGNELGQDAIKEYTQSKTVYVELGKIESSF